jgi:hypothetical protein
MIIGVFSYGTLFYLEWIFLYKYQRSENDHYVQGGLVLQPSLYLLPELRELG